MLNKPRFTHIKQCGEMGYGQPYFEVPATQDEIEASGWERKLVIARTSYEQITTCLDSGEVTVFKYDKLDSVYCRDGKAVVHPMCFSDVSAAANYFGDRLPPEFYEHYKTVLVEVPHHA